MTASPITLRACIPAPDQVTPEQAYFKDLNFYKKTLFHTPFLSRGRAVTLLEYRDAQVVFEVDDWFSMLPQAVKRYLLPLQSAYAKWYEENVRHLTQNYSYCTLCKQKETNLQRHYLQHHTRWRAIWFCPIPGCPSSLSSKEGLVRHLQTRQHARSMELNLKCAVSKQIANQNCFWPVNQTMADKLLRTSKRIIRYVALYSMAGVAMESRLFRIHPSARDTPFIDACVAFLTPKMDLSQVMPSGCHLRKVALPSAKQLAVEDRPSVSDYKEDEQSIDPSGMHMAVSAPVFQPYRGATGRAWMAQEYGLTLDTSSLLSSGMERDDTDDEICSFDLGPEPMDPSGESCIPSDEWLDDIQQGLKPGSSEPSQEYHPQFQVMPNRPSILDMMHNDMAEDETSTPPSPERALMPTIGLDYDYTMEEPPAVLRIQEAPRQSTPQPEPPTPNIRPRPASQLPRPRASSVPPSTHPAKRLAVRYQPVAEQVTPPITPPRAHAVAQTTVQDTPSPVQKPGRSRGRGTWRAPLKTAPGVGTRSRTRQAELEQTQAKQAMAARDEWPPSPDPTREIQRDFRELRLHDVPRDTHKELQQIVPDLPDLDENQNRNLPKPPAAGLMTQHHDIFFIPPPRVVGGARGNSAPVSTATLGLIHRHNPSLAALLREDPGSMTSQSTRRRVYSTMRLIRTGMLGQLDSLQQWEEAMHRQDDA